MDAECKRNPKALFMAFGTKGDVLPLAVIALALASKQRNYEVTFVTNAAHENLKLHLAKEDISMCSVSTPPVIPLEIYHEETKTCLQRVSPIFRRRALEYQHQKECLAVIEKHFEKGADPKSDFIVINFFALDGTLQSFFKCVVSLLLPMLFLTVLHQHLSRISRLYILFYITDFVQPLPIRQLCWMDVMHWMWPLFSHRWTSWRIESLHLSPYPLLDPVTEFPLAQDWPDSPLVLYGVSREVTEFPVYWPRNVHVCGFWFPPINWELPNRKEHSKDVAKLSNQFTLDNIPGTLCCFLNENLVKNNGLIFIGLSSIGSMGYIDNPEGMLLVLREILHLTAYNIIFLTSGYEPLDSFINLYAQQMVGSVNSSCSFYLEREGVLLYDKRLYCYSGSIPYGWLFPKCSIVIHHGGSGTTAAALHAGIPQIICPFILDQFYWAEKMHWIGVAPPPLEKRHLIPEKSPESVSNAVEALSKSIHMTESAEMQVCAKNIATKIQLEDGIENAVCILAKEVCLSS